MKINEKEARVGLFFLTFYLYRFFTLLEVHKTEISLKMNTMKANTSKNVEPKFFLLAGPKFNRIVLFVN